MSSHAWIRRSLHIVSVHKSNIILPYSSHVCQCVCSALTAICHRSNAHQALGHLYIKHTHSHVHIANTHARTFCQDTSASYTYTATATRARMIDVRCDALAGRIRIVSAVNHIFSGGLGALAAGARTFRDLAVEATQKMRAYALVLAKSCVSMRVRACVFVCLCTIAHGSNWVSAPSVRQRVEHSCGQAETTAHTCACMHARCVDI